jgi:muconate cycloisomerase
MRIRSFHAYLVRLPLKRPFAHASTTRQESDNIIIRCQLADGTEGWGEGVPRDYVTGETPEGCLAQLAATDVPGQFGADCGSWPDALRLGEGFELAQMGDDSRGCYGNALRCALETSILDAYGRLFGEPVSTVTRHFEPAKPIRDDHSTVRYSTAIDAGSLRKARRKALMMRLYGFHQCKVKVGVAGEDDVARLRTIRRWIGRRVDLRIDANEAWRPSEVLPKMESLKRFGISCVEQPVAHADVESLAELRPRLGVPVMLDESLTSEQDAQRAIAEQTCDLFNIRLSKCGGFLRSLRLARLAHDAGLAYQLGCHPGESGILSAAGRHWATSVAGIRYLEGSYDRHLFRRLLTREDMTFRYGGRAAALTGPGLGVTIDPNVLRGVTVREQFFNLE